MNAAAPKANSWTGADQCALDELEAKSDKLTIEDTGLARSRELNKHTAASLLRTMLIEERNDFLNEFKDV
jgi:hypothetical protein